MKCSGGRSFSLLKSSQKCLYGLILILIFSDHNLHLQWEGEKAGFDMDRISDLSQIQCVGDQQGSNRICRIKGLCHRKTFDGKDLFFVQRGVTKMVDRLNLDQLNVDKLEFKMDGWTFKTDNVSSLKKFKKEQTNVDLKRHYSDGNNGNVIWHKYEPFQFNSGPFGDRISVDLSGVAGHNVFEGVVHLLYDQDAYKKFKSEKELVDQETEWIVEKSVLLKRFFPLKIIYGIN